jgi:hypothetical protein
VRRRLGGKAIDIAIALIGWQPRNCVTAAHNLKISQATKVYNELLWDEDWVDEEDCSGVDKSAP